MTEDDEEDYEPPGLWTSFGTALRLIVGWFCVAIGALNLLVEVDRTDGTPDGPYLIHHAVLLVGGVLLLALGWIGPRPGVIGYVTGATVTLTGMIVSAIPATRTICCVDAFDMRHGFPYTFLAHDPGGPWHVDSQHALANLLFWGFCGLFALLTVSLFRRVPQGPEPEERHYIEHRTPAEEPEEHRTNLAG